TQRPITGVDAGIPANGVQRRGRMKEDVDHLLLAGVVFLGITAILPAIVFDDLQSHLAASVVLGRKRDRIRVVGLFFATLHMERAIRPVVIQLGTRVVGAGPGPLADNIAGRFTL